MKAGRLSNMVATLGFVGFGEAAYHLAKGLKQAGVAAIFAFDIHSNTPLRREKIRERASETGTQPMESNADLAAAADVVIAAVTADQATKAAEQTASYWDEVARPLREMGVEPMMATATAHRMDWAAELGLREKFGGEFPETYREVLDAIREMPAVQA